MNISGMYVKSNVHIYGSMTALCPLTSLTYSCLDDNYVCLYILNGLNICSHKNIYWSHYRYYRAAADHCRRGDCNRRHSPEKVSHLNAVLLTP